MPVDMPADRASLMARVYLAVYRLLGVPVYLLLLLGYWMLPFLRTVLRSRLAFALPSRGDAPVIWFHASSVGEVSTIAPVVAEIGKVHKGTVVVSTMTASGLRRAHRILGEIEVFLLPFDFLYSMRRLVSGLKPACLIIGETEIWPNLVIEMRNAGSPVILLNGRISEKSFPRYRLIRPLMRQVLSLFSLCLMRTRRDAERMIALGADPDAIMVAGNTKYDILPEPPEPGTKYRIRQDLGISGNRKVIALGSAREGESEIVFRAVERAELGQAPLLIVAPRHLSLVPRIEQICRGFDMSSSILPSAASAGGLDPDLDVLVVAEMGRLLDIYAASDVAIVGGTFKPFGGHNPLEPASQEAVTVVGPFIQNIKDDIDYLSSRGCAFVTDEAGLADLLRRVFSDDEKRAEMGRSAARAVQAKKGTARKCVEMMAARGLLP
jgi:3-deoxy-D-manno-octulosonic-acid transferase